jgi:hypothetical protein
MSQEGRHENQRTLLASCRREVDIVGTKPPVFMLTWSMLYLLRRFIPDLIGHLGKKTEQIVIHKYENGELERHQPSKKEVNLLEEIHEV